ncbi:MAG TPA: M24 family metallopeptidase [Candidatus Binatia bacterium]
MYYPDLSGFGVDNDRLASQRLSRLQQAMQQHNLAALMLTDWLNIRYATNSVFMMNLRATAVQRFVLVPATGAPLICQRQLSSRARGPSCRFDSFMFGMRPPVATRDFAAQTKANLRGLGITTERVGVDCLNLEAVEALRNTGIQLVDGSRAIYQARAVKTTDELQLIRWTTRAKEKGYDLVRAALHEADLPEERLSRIMLDSLLDQGFEAGSEFVSIYESSKARTHNEPMGTDMVVVDGDLVICDATVAGPGGYYSDFARTFSRGRPTAQSRNRYREAYQSLQDSLPLIKPGPCTELFARFGQHSSSRIAGLDGFHGVGLCIYESPWLRGGDPPEYAVDLEENMIVALEINHYPVKLEHLLRVTDSGAEILSRYPVDPELVPA